MCVETTLPPAEVSTEFFKKLSLRRKITRQPHGASLLSPIRNLQIRDTGRVTLADGSTLDLFSFSVERGCKAPREAGGFAACSRW